MSVLIVNYHYIRDNKPQKGIYPKSLKELNNDIEILYKNGYNFISPNEIFKSGKNVLLTFDDGLKEQLNAYEFLNKKGIPAIFYISTYPFEEKVLNVHKIHYIRTILKDEEFYQEITKNIEVKFPENINEFYRYDNLEVKKLKYLLNFILDENTKNILISNIFNNLIDEKIYSKNLYMNKEDIHKLEFIGTHTHKHIPLATLDEDKIREEIKVSLDLLDRDIFSISYPYGGKSAVNEKVINVVKEFNFDFGVTMFRGINKGNENKFLLNRIDTNDLREFV